MTPTDREQIAASAGPDHARDATILPLTPLNWIDRLPEDARQAVRGRMHSFRLQVGQPIWLSGQPRSGVAQIVSGRITLYSGSAEGRELRYLTFTDGDCMGEDSLAGPGQHHHSTAAETPTRISVLSTADFWVLADAWPVLHAALHGHNARKSKLLFEYIDSLMLDPVDVRIAGRICLLMSLQEAATGVAERPVLEISHSGLADMTGLTRQTVSSVLQRWRKSGLVDLGYRQLVILDPAALRGIRDGSPMRSFGPDSDGSDRL